MGQTLFYKDQDNQAWLIGIYSNNYEDRQGEIISWSAHEEYAKWLDDTGIKPPLVLMHEPRYPGALHAINLLSVMRGKISNEEYNATLFKMYEKTALAITERVIPLNGFVFVFAKVLPERESVVQTLMKSAINWGMSHGFIKLDNTDKIIEKYRAFEFTLLPDFLAANSITKIVLGEQTMDELKTLDKDQRDLVESVLNNTAEDIEAATQKAQEILNSVLAHKDVTELSQEHGAPPEQSETTPAEDGPSEQAATESEEEDHEELSYEKMRGQLFKDFRFSELFDAFKTLSDSVAQSRQELADLRADLDTLKRSDDEKIASAFAPPAWSTLFKKQDRDVTNPDLLSSLKEDAAKSRLAEQTEENPLALGFWNLFRRG